MGLVPGEGAASVVGVGAWAAEAVLRPNRYPPTTPRVAPRPVDKNFRRVDMGQGLPRKVGKFNQPWASATWALSGGVAAFLLSRLAKPNLLVRMIKTGSRNRSLNTAKANVNEISSPM